MKKPLLLLLAVIVLSAHAPAAEAAKRQKGPLTVKARLDRNYAFIGDKLEYTISVSADRHLEVQLPDFGARLGEFTVKNSALRTREFFGTRTITGRYILSIYATGKFTIPRCTIKYKAKGDNAWKQVETNEQPVEIKSLLDKTGPVRDIRDIKGPVNLSLGSGLYMFIFLLAVVIAVIFAVKFLSPKQDPRQAALPLRPAHEIAYAQLEELETKDLIRQGRIKEYFIELSGIVRHYLENRFHLRAPEMTTEEFLVFAHGYAQLANRDRTMLKEFLSACDLVKFAKYTPPADEIDAAFASARKFVDQTKEVTI